MVARHLVAAGIAVFDRALRRLPTQGDKWEPRRVFLFSGHMVDAPGRETVTVQNVDRPVFSINR